MFLFLLLHFWSVAPCGSRGLCWRLFGVCSLLSVPPDDVDRRCTSTIYRGHDRPEIPSRFFSDPSVSRYIVIYIRFFSDPSVSRLSLIGYEPPFHSYASDPTWHDVYRHYSHASRSLAICYDALRSSALVLEWVFRPYPYEDELSQMAGVRSRLS